MNRRAFVSGLVAVFVAPHVAEAQQAGRARIGYLQQIGHLYYLC